MLEQIDMFSSLSSKELRDIEKIAKTRKVLRGEVIFSQGDVASDLYLVENGQVEILMKDFKNDCKQLAVLRNGDFFGEMALFDKGSLRSATARALQNSTLVIIPGLGFERLLQEKPSISFKLLSAFSKRLKDTSQKAVSGSGTVVASAPSEAQILTVASPRNESGKSMFATTLAQVLSAETTRRVLLIDLDFSFADATYLLGVISPKSILEMSRLIEKGDHSWEVLSRGLVRHGESSYSLPAPNNIIDGEKINSQSLIGIVKALKKFFDYIILDTDSAINEILLNAIDLADRVFFLVNLDNARTIRSTTRYFQGLGKLDYDEERFSLFAHRVKSDFKAEKYKGLFRFPLYGGLPETDFSTVDFGKTYYQIEPGSTYCNILRQMIRDVLKEQIKLPQTTNQKGFLYRFFFDDQQRNAETEGGAPKKSSGKKTKAAPKIMESDLTAILKYINTSILYGNLEEAREQTLQLLTYCNWSSNIFQMLGEIYYGERNFAQANDVLKQALVLDQGNYIAMGYLSQITNDEAMFQKAIDLVESKLAEKPGYPDLYNDLGKLWELRGDWEKACESFKKALEKNPKYLEAKMNIASVLGHEEEYEEAVTYLEGITTKNIRVYYLLGDYYFSMGRFAESKSCFQSVQEINPNYLDITQRLQHLENYFERLLSLIEMHQKIIKDHPNYPDIRLKLGNFYLLMGKTDEAKEEFRRALEINPKYEEARILLDSCNSGNKQLTFQGIDPAPRIPGSGFSLSIDFLCSFREASPKGSCHVNCTLAIRNLRTSRLVEAEPHCRSSKGQNLSTVDISPLGSISPGDILLVRVMNRETGQSMLAMPHSVTETEIQKKEISVSLEHANSEALADTPNPVRYFFVRVKNPVIAQAVASKPKSCKVILENSRLDLQTVGQVSTEDPNEVTFVLKSPKGRNAALVGDTLQLAVSLNGKEKYRHEAHVTPDDIAAFSKELDTSDFMGFERAH